MKEKFSKVGNYQVDDKGMLKPFTKRGGRGDGSPFVSDVKRDDDGTSQEPRQTVVQETKAGTLVSELSDISKIYKPQRDAEPAEPKNTPSPAPAPSAPPPPPPKTETPRAGMFNERGERVYSDREFADRQKPTPPPQPKTPDAKPPEPKPVEQKPPEPKPADTKRSEPKPQEPKPPEPKPVEQKPPEPKPAEAERQTEQKPAERSPSTVERKADKSSSDATAPEPRRAERAPVDAAAQPRPETREAARLETRKDDIQPASQKPDGVNNKNTDNEAVIKELANGFRLLSDQLVRLTAQNVQLQQTIKECSLVEYDGF